MQILFEELIRIQVRHDFYAKGYGNDVQIIPMVDTTQIFADYGLLFRTIPGGMVLLYELSPATGGPLRPIQESLRFRFLLQIRRRSFHNYTLIPLEHTTSSIFHLHNFQDNLQSSEVLLTADTASQYLTEDDWLTLKPQWFEYGFNAPGSVAELEVLDFFGNQVYQSSLTKQGGEFSAQVNLREHTPGRFTLLINSSPEFVFYADDALVGRGNFGIVEIYNDSGLPFDYRFINPDGTVQSKTYTINFQRRDTFWKYLIVLQYRTGLDPSNLSIEHPDGGVEFERQSATTLSDGSTVIPFVSNVPLPFQEQPTPGISLNQTNGNGGLLQIDHLPNASSHRIVPDPTEDKIFSEIYYYI